MRVTLTCSELSFSLSFKILIYFDFPSLQDQRVDFHKPEEENISPPLGHKAYCSDIIIMWNKGADICKKHIRMVPGT